MSKMRHTPRPANPLTTTFRQTERRLFWTAFLARIAMVAVLLAIAGDVNSLSRDAIEYNHRGIQIADQYARGEVNWERFVDDGWFEIIGIFYWLLGPYLETVLVFNAILSAAASVLVYRIGAAVFRDESVGRLSGYTFALFPSIVYYTALPLKEAFAVFGILCVVWGITSTNIRRSPRGLWWCLLGLAVITCVRVYLAIISVGLTALCLIPFRLKGGVPGLLQLATIGAVAISGIFVVVNVLGIKPRDYRHLQYFDIGYLNDVRYDMTMSGRGKMFDNPDDAKFGTSLQSDLTNIGKGIFFFLFSVDPTNVKRERQYAALPEMIFFVYFLPSLAVGIWAAWCAFPRSVLPVLLFCLVLLTVYGAGTTNMGAMYRWRVQALPFFILLIVNGAAVRRRTPLYPILLQMRASARPMVPVGARMQRGV